MKVARQRMMKTLRTELLSALILPLLGVLSSCNPTELTGRGTSASITSNTDGSLDNKALVYEDDWHLKAGPDYGPANVSMKSFLERTPELITTNNSLTRNCDFIYSQNPINLSDCIRALSRDDSSTLLTPIPRREDRTYIYPTDSDEFYQVNMLYHISKGLDKFLNKLSYAFYKVRWGTPPNLVRSIPQYLEQNNLFWFGATNVSEQKYFRSRILTSYAQCTLEGNASFNPVGPTLCFGSISQFPGFYFVQDPSVIYHEFGHAVVSILLNLRNGTTTADYHQFRSAMGNAGYDEAGAINEGIADYFSYVIHGREMVGEFALGKTFKQSRPMSEASSMHIRGIAETSEGRLSYPQFLLYDPNYPDQQIEDIHYAGQITTHYLVALTKALKNTCYGNATDPQEEATNVTMLLLAETLSELGNLKSTVDQSGGIPLAGVSFTNLNETNSYLWQTVMTPINHRRFFQVLGKNILKYVSRPSSGLCPSFTQRMSERLLDDYGLLLFRTYNDNGNSSSSRTVTYATAGLPFYSTALTNVQEDNRRKSVLVSKELIDLAQKTETYPSRVSFYIIDNSSDMKAFLSALLFKGIAVPLSKGTAGTEYNNNNIKASPGEVVAIIPNLINNSNSTMAGVQILGTDWDHVSVDPDTGSYQPCALDSLTTEAQGAVTGGTCDQTATDYKRTLGRQNTVTNKYDTDVVAPVCMVQLDEGNGATWISQNDFRKKQGLSLVDKDCLGYQTSANSDNDFTFNPNECLIRFLPGANTAHFSKIDPQKSYYETVLKDQKSVSFNPGNVMVMEVNKWIPPGTKFRCRLRARFSNCSDCFSDGSASNDDYLDSDYNGSAPFKVINFEFEIND